MKKFINIEKMENNYNLAFYNRDYPLKLEWNFLNH